MSRALVDSGINWIGKIPENWKKCKLKNIADVINGSTPNRNDESNFSFDTGINWIKPENLNFNNYIKNTKEKISNEEVKGATIIDYKSVLVNCVGDVGKWGIVNEKYSINQQIDAIVFKDNIIFDYGKWLIAASQDYVFSDAQSNLLPFLSLSRHKNINYIIPPKEEQTKIANYLDDKCSKIDKTIEDNNKSIELLIEYKQSKINELLSPKNGWKRVRIKNFAELHGRIGWQGLKAEEFIDEGVYLVTGTDFINGKVNWETCYHISEERYEEAKDIKLKKDDLLITKDGTVGKLAYIDYLPDKASLNSHLLLIRPFNKMCSNKYLYWQLQTSHFEKYYKLKSSGTIMESLTQEVFSNYSFYVPSVEVQFDLVKKIDNLCSNIDKIIDYRKKIIEKLDEYKKSLIYEVVTGKKEV